MIRQHLCQYWQLNSLHDDNISTIIDNITMILFANISDIDNISPSIDQTLGLVLVRNMADDAVGHEVGGDGVTTETGDVRPQDAKNLIQELLDKCGQTSHLNFCILVFIV